MCVYQTFLSELSIENPSNHHKNMEINVFEKSYMKYFLECLKRSTELQSITVQVSWASGHGGRRDDGLQKDVRVHRANTKKSQFVRVHLLLVAPLHLKLFTCR